MWGGSKVSQQREHLQQKDGLFIIAARPRHHFHIVAVVVPIVPVIVVSVVVCHFDSARKVVAVGRPMDCSLLQLLRWLFVSTTSAS